MATRRTISGNIIRTGTTPPSALNPASGTAGQSPVVQSDASVAWGSPLDKPVFCAWGVNWNSTQGTTSPVDPNDIVPTNFTPIIQSQGNLLLGDQNAPFQINDYPNFAARVHTQLIVTSNTTVQISIVVDDYAWVYLNGTSLGTAVIGSSTVFTLDLIAGINDLLIGYVNGAGYGADAILEITGVGGDLATLLGGNGAMRGIVEIPSGFTPASVQAPSAVVFDQATWNDSTMYPRWRAQNTIAPASGAIAFYGWQTSTDGFTWDMEVFAGDTYTQSIGITSGSQYARARAYALTTRSTSPTPSGWVASSIQNYAGSPYESGGSSSGLPVLSGVTGNTTGGDYAITSSYATVQCAGAAPLEQTLAPGKYYFSANISIVNGTTANDVYWAQLYNVTSGSAIDNPRQLSSLGGSAEGQLILNGYLNLSAASVIAVHVYNATAARGTVKLTRSLFDAISMSALSASYPLPVISSFTPTYGKSVSVTLTGAGFTGATAVTFNGTAATSVTVVSDTEITCVSPSSFTTGHIAVTGLGGTATSGGPFSPTAPSKAPQSISNANLALLLLMTEGSGTTTTDSSSFARTFTLNSGASWTTDSAGQPAIALSTLSTANITGSDTGMPTGNATMTVAAKIKTIGTIGSLGQSVLTWGSAPSNEKAFMLILTSGAVGGPSYPDYTISGATNAADGNWHVLVMTLSGGNVTMYLDGASVYSGSVGGPDFVSGGTTFLGYQGGVVGGDGQYGIVFDYAAVWSRVLTSAEITSLT